MTPNRARNKRAIVTCVHRQTSIRARSMRRATVERVEVGEVVGLERLALDDREVDPALVQPRGMYGGVDQDQVLPGALQSPDRRPAAVC